MKNHALLLLLSLFVSASSGCAQLASLGRSLERAGVVSVETTGAPRGAALVRAADGRVGHAAIVAPDRVLTVAHVVGDASRAWVAVGRRGAWVEARVVERLARAPEELVVLELALDEGWAGALLGFTGFGAERVLEPGAEGLAVTVATARGLRPLIAAELRPGDSGSPVLDPEGRLVGLLSGRGAQGAVVTRLAPAGGVELAARR